jgi:hypothetical protein
MSYKFNPFTGNFDETGPSVSALNVLGTVANEAALPGGATTGDVYQAEDTGVFYVWDGSAWDNLGTLVGPQGPTGATGATGPAGTDGADGADGVGVPAGGTTGQLLKKSSGTDYDTAWGGADDIYVIACSDEATALTTGTAKVTFRMPSAGTLTAVKATVTTAPVGSALIVDINEAGTSVLSTKLSIDDGEETSATAATPAVISDSALSDDAEITIDIDQVGSGTAGAGLKVYLYITRG